jgi:ABC-type multidrug transport system ATPase subunit
MKISNLNVKTKKGKFILHNINLIANKGELLAIMGPSGCGKTTILDLLTQNITSRLVYDGKLESKGSIKYVPQEDFLHGFYTVRDYLNHYISLNFKGISKAARNEIIKTNAELTGLTSALNTKVGDVFRKGLSGGQKKKT